ncbi:hypothetical protein [Paenibacillus sp. J22TS3]|uniref:hypothetical protein n=1 Tax=Paenibacillus sp. J22TS3 TaxID=2807192 RepID=UPI001B1BB461|nr:hypothetical protein [Paenibacillus sp. J22TS3]GIP23809.1 hypothetical protein J22TS3_40840 [Paenibacillus sp. J22TS3]
MNKKWLTIGGAVGLSVAVMAATGMSAMAGASGYEAYKSALKSTHSIQSATVQSAAYIQDNGSDLASLKGQFQIDFTNGNSSGNVEFSSGGTQKNLGVYRQDGQTILKPAERDTYYVAEGGKHKHAPRPHTADPETAKQVESVIDTLVGNMKDYVNLEPNSDGSKQITVQLDHAQIPSVVNTIAPLAIKEASKHREDTGNSKPGTELPLAELNLKNSLPELTTQIQIEQVVVKATIDSSNHIKHQEADLVISGADNTGAGHKLKIHLQADLSGLNSTTPNKVDLSGKKVQKLKQVRHGESALTEQR